MQIKSSTSTEFPITAKVFVAEEQGLAFLFAKNKTGQPPPQLIGIKGMHEMYEEVYNFKEENYYGKFY